MKFQDILPQFGLGKRRKSKRKYPIKRNEQGLSARQQCFQLFDQGNLPAGVAPSVKVSKLTARRYFADWKKQPENQHLHLQVKRWLKNDRKLSP